MPIVKSLSQVENVPADHDIYVFLHRMEVRGVLDGYDGTVIPISRKKVAGYIGQISSKRESLSRSEREFLDLYRLEFAYDLGYGVVQATELFGTKNIGRSLSDIFSQKQKYLYTWNDGNGNSLFIDGLASLEFRNRSGDVSAGLTLSEIGFRTRGTLGNRVGYYLDGINGQVSGDRAFALEDPRLQTNYTYRIVGEDFYDKSAGYVRLDAEWFGVQVGRERIRWRENYGSSLFLSNYPPTFDFIRFDASYGVVTYNFIHGWLMGPRELIWFSEYLDPLPHHDPKYGVFHRLEFSLFKDRFRVGLNESLIYTRSSPEIGYLNPVSFFISTERNLGDRDRLMLGIDFTIRPITDIEFKFGAVFDDINFERSFTRSWDNRWAIHAGFYYVDPFGLPDIDLFFDYTRVEPYVYSHHRSPDRYYAHNDFILGHPLGPNSDETLVRVLYKPSWQWRFWFEFKRQRHGDNVVDEEGNVIRNVGGDFLFPWRRDIDPMEKNFLDGILTEKFYYRASVRYEIFKQIVIGCRIEWANRSTEAKSLNHTTISAGIWVDY